MSRIYTCYVSCRLATQTMEPTLTGFQGIKRCVQYMASHPHKIILDPSNFMMSQISSDLHGVGIKLKSKQPKNF